MARVVGGDPEDVRGMTDGGQDRALNLDSTAGRSDRGNDQRCEVVGAERDATRGGSRSTSAEQRDTSACTAASAREAY